MHNTTQKGLILPLHTHRGVPQLCRTRAVCGVLLTPRGLFQRTLTSWLTPQMTGLLPAGVSGHGMSHNDCNTTSTTVYYNVTTSSVPLQHHCSLQLCVHTHAHTHTPTPHPPSPPLPLGRYTSADNSPLFRPDPIPAATAAVRCPVRALQLESSHCLKEGEGQGRGRGKASQRTVMNGLWVHVLCW